MSLYAQRYSSDIRIGLALDIGGVGDQAVNDAVLDALVEISQRLRGSISGGAISESFGDRFWIHYRQLTGDTFELEQEFRYFGVSGYQMVIAMGHPYEDIVQRAARDFPDTHFIHLNARRHGGQDNVTSIVFNLHEAAFVAGAFAASIGEFTNGDLGFIGAVDVPLIDEVRIGFIAGAAFRNPAFKRQDAIRTAFLGNDLRAYSDVSTAEAIARSMYTRGVQVIFHMAGLAGGGVIQAASDTNRFVIGSIADQHFRYINEGSAINQGLSDSIVTSIIVRYDIVLSRILETYINQPDQPFANGIVEYGIINERVVDIAPTYLAPFNDSSVLLDSGEIESLRRLMFDGLITVPRTSQELDVWLDALL